jgi:Domain of unknown function (DUF4386)
MTATVQIDRRPVTAGAGAGFATARTAGLLYLTIIVCGLFAEVGVRSRLVEHGDPTATARNILESPMLFRFGVAADIVMLVCDVALAVVLFRLLAPISRTLSMVAAAFRLTQSAVLGLNVLSMFQALRILGDADYLDPLGRGPVEALALLSLDAHRYGYILGLTFFGVATMVIGYMARRSHQMPGALGLLLLLAGAGYVVDTFSFFMISGYDGSASPIVLAPALIAEIWLGGWLLLRGRVLESPDVSPAAAR